MRLFHALFVVLAVVALGLFAISCGSNSAQYRVVDTITGLSYNLDIDVNVASPSSTTATFSNVGFGSVEPSGYKKIATGADPIVVFQTGTTTQVIASTTLNLGSNQYTVLLLGPGGTETTAFVQLLTDNNTAPTAGNGEFRVVNASPSSPGGSVDAYLVPPGTNIGAVSPNVSGLGYSQPSSYVSLTAANYLLYVTPHNNKTPYINGQSYTLAAGQIYTLVLVDVSGGGALSGVPLLVTDVK
jgi:Domain of unknown function (DUF4397)